MKPRLLAVLLAAATLLATHASARSLDGIRQRRALGLCAHPNSLPFASKAAEPPGFQIEMGRALAGQLGVSLATDWIISTIQIRRADCDIVLDVIADREAQEESGLRISKPYYRTGAALTVDPDSTITSFHSLNERTKVGVQVGSAAAMVLGRRHVGISIFGFEDDALDALINHEIDAATVTPATAGYYNLRHPGRTVRVLGLDDSDPILSWNVAVGMMRPDERLRAAIDEALDSLRSAGTIGTIYGRYGITLLSPQ
ncbi:substrate-binding periplasmic protein [Limobrevibacterium gyesilva]|uniref:Transporter substrate-binding domain-containing protein n=1 Tax=Limobrevibacterium gyesilva TaxID=2991712 RepID=A0AA41YN25_9PROT|nr:transporter substrate-binding domain-containing protein [Limobrevibacterium gyesilva]MCW3473513.1 transporter substrate-binding domain-containing protein [Limobrevibacterium gyesilva]